MVNRGEHLIATGDRPTGVARMRRGIEVIEAARGPEPRDVAIAKEQRRTAPQTYPPQPLAAGPAPQPGRRTRGIRAILREILTEPAVRC